jgi:hypothetical protein
MPASIGGDGGFAGRLAKADVLIESAPSFLLKETVFRTNYCRESINA